MTDSKPFQILSLAGGGFRGLYTAQVLADFEEEFQMRVGRAFDLIAGTSVGGILALAVAYEIPMADVVELFRLNGKRIFSKVPWYQSWFGIRAAPYSTDSLERVLREFFDDKIIADLKHPVIIPSVNYSTGYPQIFKTPHHETFRRDWRYSIVDVALATSAAPTYFRKHFFEGAEFVDGGLFANNPSLQALHEAEQFFNLSPRDGGIRLMSIGTLSANRSANPSTNKNGGYLDWAESRNLSKAARNIMDLTLSSLQENMKQIVKHRFDSTPEHFVQIDESLTASSAGHVGLDEVSDAAINILTSNAKFSSKKALGMPNVIQMLQNQADAPHWFHGPYA